VLQVPFILAHIGSRRCFNCLVIDNPSWMMDR
jgi:hypothetical protein